MHVLLKQIVLFAAAVLVALPPVSAIAEGAAPRKIIIDQDTFGPGGTNMQSILMLLQSPDVQVLGITVVSGDGWRDENVNHVLRLLEIAGRTDVPVYAGAIHPLLNSAERTEAWERLYGPLVYKGAWSKQPSVDGSYLPRGLVRHADPYLVPPAVEGMAATKVQKQSAVDFMIDAVHRYPGEVTIWAGGPLTDLALAGQLDPLFASLAKELVFMGGSFNPRPTASLFSAEYEDSPRREFNIRWDPEAASMVMHEPWRHVTMIPVDPTTDTMYTSQMFEQIRDGKARFDSYLYQYRQVLPMWDETAAAAWLDPAVVTVRTTRLVDIDTSFTAGYGDVLSWPVGKGPGLGEQRVDVVNRIDPARLDQMVVNLLSAPSQPAR
jgi:inosine-uridine nucleoside N-ribohydrolase